MVRPGGKIKDLDTIKKVDEQLRLNTVGQGSVIEVGGISMIKVNFKLICDGNKKDLLGRAFGFANNTDIAYVLEDIVEGKTGKYTFIGRKITGISETDDSCQFFQSNRFHIYIAAAESKFDLDTLKKIEPKETEEEEEEEEANPPPGLERLKGNPFSTQQKLAKLRRTLT